MRAEPGGIAGVVLAFALAACQAAAPIDMTDPRVTAGAEKSCADLEISSVRCTLLTLRAARSLDDERPDHAPVASQAIHEAEAPAEGQERLPDSVVVPGVVVFTLEDGSRVGVPLLCPRTPSVTDDACNPAVR
jgi:hypothetical protein